MSQAKPTRHWTTCFKCAPPVQCLVCMCKQLCVDKGVQMFKFLLHFPSIFVGMRPIMMTNNGAGSWKLNQCDIFGWKADVLGCYMMEATGVSIIPSEKQRLSEGCQWYWDIREEEEGIGRSLTSKTNSPALQSSSSCWLLRGGELSNPFLLVEETMTRKVVINEDKVMLGLTLFILCQKMLHHRNMHHKYILWIHASWMHTS